MKFQSGAFLHFWFVSAGPSDAFVALRASRVSRVCVACVAVLRQFLIFFIKENGPSKKNFPLRGQNPGEAPRTPLTRWACGATCLFVFGIHPA